ncbi:YbaN family protein [Berryella wangjianweii]|uniref:YbaN family protein n=1 Tax=Berryella wangjianweii TaxID=2734634 RepID=UPI0021BD569D|nr:YbaN family protein [Berryella wangjianweii]
MIDERTDNQAAGTARPSSGRVRRGMWAGAGFLFFGLALVGIALPFIPTTPFLLAAAFCFTRSSERLNRWFRSTRVYDRVLRDYETKRSMTVRAKLSVLVPVTVLLTIAFILMQATPVGRMVIVLVWVGHLVYFGLVVKTEPSNRG